LSLFVKSQVAIKDLPAGLDRVGVAVRIRVRVRVRVRFSSRVSVAQTKQIKCIIKQ
jgi:hypothetical protein